MTKKYFFDGFIDFMIKESNQICKDARLDFMCGFSSDSLKSALYDIDKHLSSDNGYIQTVIGIRKVVCDDKEIDWNYKNRVIYTDEYLRERFWC